MTRPGIEPRSLGSLVNTLPTRPMSRLRGQKSVVAKLATVVEDDQKASFSIATTPICTAGAGNQIKKVTINPQSLIEIIKKDR